MRSAELPYTSCLVHARARPLQEHESDKVALVHKQFKQRPAFSLWQSSMCRPTPTLKSI